ncbi:MAG: peptide chain release factor 2 [Sulfurovum sp.]|nr:peptide chain release factor 2 [Sulfurovum sp.]
MDAYEYSELLKSLTIKMENIKNIVKPDKLQARLQAIGTMQEDSSFWLDVSKAGIISQEKTKTERLVATYSHALDAVNDASDYFELSQAEHDEETLEMLYEDAPSLQESTNALEVQMMLSGEHDANNAIVSIHPGAGGTESQDWANMLYRMYLRWAERRGFKVEVLDYQPAEEAGIKDVSFIIKGENAYGYLKVENGIHRLVRISPFDSNAKRHTSFSSVMVSPEVDDDIDITIEDKDIRIDTYRSSGAGGQHVNKTESAIRLTHIQTNIVVQCQNDRSQHKNKAAAMKMLKSRLYEYEMAKKQALLDGVEKSDNGWGHQIRSYVMQPYQQVKDTRSNIPYTNIDAILDGDINQLLEGILIAQAK